MSVRGFRKVEKGEFDRFLLSPGPMEPMQVMHGNGRRIPGVRFITRWHLGLGGSKVALERDGEYFLREVA